MRKLRLYFSLFSLLLAMPVVVLVWRIYSNLEKEAFFFYRSVAEGVVAAVNDQLVESLLREEQRPFNHYRYVYVAERAVPQQEGLNLSPLASFPVESEIPGIVGYFQIEPNGSLQTPLLPTEAQMSNVEISQRAERTEVKQQLISIVTSQHTLRAGDHRPKREEVRAAELSTDEEVAKLNRNLESNVDLRLDKEHSRVDADDMQRTSLTEAEEDASESSLFQFQRKVQQASPVQAKVFDAQLEDRFSEDSDSRERVNRDEGKKRSPGTYRPLVSGIRSEVGIDSTLSEGAEVDPFAVRTVGSDWIIFERKVWWQNRRYVQGFVARLDRFVEAVLLPQLENPALPGTSSYLLFHRGELISPQAVDSAAPKPDLLYSADLRYPFSGFHLALTVEKLPDGPGHQTVNWLVWVLSILFFGGLFGIYRLTATQIELSQKKSDFVSAVSHELKSPLTAIRMYGEILMEGWVEEERREGYYRHIRDESERLSRLIQNVLTLAQLEKSEWKSNLSVVDPVQFVTEVVQKLRTQVQRAGFEIDIARKGELSPVQVDRDALVQILINLIDNAIKFAGEAEKKKIVLTVDRIGDETWIRVRDFGSGIPAREMKKIFGKFYRVEDELTRTARGTGIGLSLVKMLAKSMDAEVDVRNCNPGAEFSIHLKRLPENFSPLS